MDNRKQELLESIIAYLLEHGLADLSLRPLAAKTGTSARLLIYHFKSKEGLLGDVLEAMQQRLVDSFSVLMAKPRSANDKPPIRLFWDWAIHAKNFPYLKLLYELQILAIRNPQTYAQFLERNASTWSTLVQQVLSPELRSPTFATVCTAVFDGLFLELMSTGDRARTTRALEHFIAMARAAGPLPGTG